MQYTQNLNEFYERLLKLPHKLIARIISGLLLCYIAYLLAQITWLALSDSRSDFHVSSTSHSTIKTVNSRVDVSTINALNLFGQFDEQKVISEIKVQDAPQTSLRLTLSGTVASDDESTAAAIIENNGKQETYGVGDKITGTRATLESVAHDRVLIKQAGRLETLMLDGFDYKKPSQQRSNRAIDTPPRENRYNSPKVVDQRNNSALSQSASRLKKDINNDPGKITDYLKIIPKRKNGNIHGYQLMPGKDPEFFQSSGLKSGDIAVQMNGLDLTIPSEAAQALQALKQEQELSLLVDRNGSMTEILFTIQ